MAAEEAWVQFFRTPATNHEETHVGTAALARPGAKAPPALLPEDEFQAQLNLPRSERVIRLHRVLRLLVVRRVGNSVQVGAVPRERGGLDGEPVRGDGETLIVAVKEVGKSQR